MRDRERGRVGARQPLETVAPYFLVVPLRAPGEAAGVTLLERRGARRVVAAEADRHHADAPGVDLRPRRKIIEDRCRVVLGVITQIEIAEADAFAVAGPINNEAGNAARDQVRHAFEILGLLGDIEPIEKHHGRYLAGGIRRFGMDINGRKTGAAVGDFDVLHARPLDVFRRVPETRNATHVGVEPLFALRLQEAFADVVIGAGAVQILRAARRKSFGDALASAVFDSARLARPLPKPRIVVADAFLQAQADPVNLADLGATPRRHVEADQQAVRPAIVLGEISEGELFEL